jgi:hypothetical protein
VGPLTEVYLFEPAKLESSTPGSLFEVRMTVREPVPVESTPTQAEDGAAGSTVPHESTAAFVARTLAASQTSPDASTMDTLLTRKEYATLVERLTPIKLAFSAEERTWFGQILIRLRALARGIQRTDRDRGEAMAELAVALSERVDRVFGTRSMSAIDIAVVRTGSSANGLSVRRQAILRGLDVLLGSFSSGRVGVDGVQPALALVFEEIALYVVEER